MHSADPVGRLVLGVLRPRRRRRSSSHASDDVCTGLQLVNFLQDVPRDLALGGSTCRPRTAAASASSTLDRPNEPLRRLLEFEAGRRARAARRGRAAARGGSAAASGGPSGCSRAAAWRRSTRSSTPSWDIFTQRPRPVAGPARAGARSLVDDHRRAGVRGGRAPHARARAQLRLRDHGCCRSRSGARSRRSTPSRARSTTSPTIRRCRRRRSARGWRRSHRRSTALRAARRCSSRSPTRARATRSPREALHDLVDGGLQDTEQARYADLRRAARLLRARRGRGRRRLHRRLRRRPAAAGRGARASRSS